jgi:hypothetical protein
MTLPMHLEMFEGDEIRHHCHFGLKGFWYQNKFQQDVRNEEKLYTHQTLIQEDKTKCIY